MCFLRPGLEEAFFRGHMKIKSKWFSAFIVALVCYWLFSVIGKLYFDNDNLMIGVVTNGIYSNDVFCQYLHPLLCLTIRGLSFLLPTADCFLVITTIFVFIELMVLTYIALLETENKPWRQWNVQDWILRVMLVCGTIFLSTAINIWSINYTTQTASFIFAGLISLFEYKNKRDQKALFILGTLLVIFGFMMRIEGALIFVPYVLLQIATELWTAKKDTEGKKVKETATDLIKLLAPCVIIIAALLISRTVFWSIEPHASARDYNEVRTISGDFHMQDWEEVEDEIVNTDYTEYKSPIVWSLIDTDVLNTEKIAYIAEIGSTPRYPLNSEGLVKTLQEMWRKGFTTNLQLLLLLIITLILAVRNIICINNKWLRLESIFAVGGSFLILFYFTIRGRAPLHVWQSTVFACVTILIVAALNDVRKRRTTAHIKAGIGVLDAVFMLMISAVLYFSIGQVIATSSFHSPTTAFTARINVDESEFAQTLEDDSLYIWPSFWQTLAGKYVEKGKLPSREVLEHNIPLAYWSYGQVYFTDVLKRMNAENPAKALLERPNTYLVKVRGMDDFVLDYMRAHYGEDLELEEIGEVNKYGYYRLVRGDGND